MGFSFTKFSNFLRVFWNNLFVFKNRMIYFCGMDENLIKARISELQNSMSGDMMIDMEIRDEIHQLEMSEKGVVCSIEDSECIACGS